MLLASLRKKKGDFYGNRPGEIFSEILLGATYQVGAAAARRLSRGGKNMVVATGQKELFTCAPSVCPKKRLGNRGRCACFPRLKKLSSCADK